MAGTGTYTLWGVAHSLYTGKIRSYLTKKGLPFRELYPTHPRFGSIVKPAVGMVVVPILETPDGRILQDTGEMIDTLEVEHVAPTLRPRTSTRELSSRRRTGAALAAARDCTVSGRACTMKSSPVTPSFAHSMSIGVGSPRTRV